MKSRDILNRCNKYGRRERTRANIEHTDGEYANKPVLSGRGLMERGGMIVRNELLTDDDDEDDDDNDEDNKEDEGDEEEAEEEEGEVAVEEAELVALKEKLKARLCEE